VDVQGRGAVLQRPVRSYPSITVESAAARAARTRIDAALATETQFEYLDEAMSDIVSDIAHRHEIPIVIDTTALEEYGIGTDTPITIKLRGISLRSALRLMLHDLDLTFVIRNEVMQITTVEEAEDDLLTRLYPVGDLLDRNETGYGDEGGPNRGTFLVNLLMDTVAPSSWDEVGGAGTIQFVDHLGALAVSQTEENFIEIDNLLLAVEELVEARNGER